MSYQNLQQYSQSDKFGNGAAGLGEPDASGLMVARRPMEDRDWDALFAAVEHKLRDCATELETLPQQAPGSQAPASRPAFTLRRIRDTVLDCVDSLDKLHAALRVKRGSQASGE